MNQNRISFRLEDLEGNQPIILLFASSDRSPAYENQMALLEEEGLLEQSGVLIARILADGDSYLQNEKMDSSSAERLLSRFNVQDQDFLIVLIGRDGTEKRRDDAPLQPGVILERISDATPSEKGPSYSG